MKRDADFFRLKAAMEDLVTRCGGQKRAGALMDGVSQQMVSLICDRDSNSMLTLRGKLALEADCGAPVVTAVEAELLGFKLVRDGAAPSGDACAYTAHAAVMKEVGDLCGVFATSVADGRFSRTDAETARRELAQLRLAIERFERVCAVTEAEAGGQS
jgi:hypothetical protein